MRHYFVEGSQSKRDVLVEEWWGVSGGGAHSNKIHIQDCDTKVV